jgi:hypothetical protein
VAQAVECLLCKHEALSSNSSPAKKKKKMYYKIPQFQVRGTGSVSFDKCVRLYRELLDISILWQTPSCLSPHSPGSSFMLSGTVTVPVVECPESGLWALCVVSGPSSAWESAMVSVLGVGPFICRALSITGWPDRLSVCPDFSLLLSKLL